MGTTVSLTVGGSSTVMVVLTPGTAGGKGDDATEGEMEEEDVEGET